MGRRKESEPACCASSSSIMFNRSWPSLRGKRPWGGSAATIALQCVVNAWWSLVASLGGGGQGEVLELDKEGVIFLTCFVISFHFLSIWPRESESCIL